MAGCAAPRQDAAAGTRTRSGSRARGPCGVPRARGDADLAAGDLFVANCRASRSPGARSAGSDARVRPAGLDLLRLGIAAARRPRLQDVRDEDVLALHPDSPSNSFRSWPARPTKGSPAILLAPGLADEQQVRVGVPGPEDGPRASGVKRTAGAGRDVAVELDGASRRSSVERLTGSIPPRLARRRAALKSDSVRSRSWVAALLRPRRAR